MKELIQTLRNIEAVKAVRNQSGVLKIELFSREIPDSEAVEIRGNLRSITPKVRAALKEVSKEGEIGGWEWIVRPEKKYQSTSLGKDKVSDRKSKGHKPGFYRVSVEE